MMKTESSLMKTLPLAKRMLGSFLGRLNNSVGRKI